ncbi:hypothetical protein AGLY_001691, partial [Aphis glycines]
MLEEIYLINCTWCHHYLVFFSTHPQKHQIVRRIQIPHNTPSFISQLLYQSSILNRIISNHRKQSIRYVQNSFIKLVSTTLVKLFISPTKLYILQASDILIKDNRNQCDYLRSVLIDFKTRSNYHTANYCTSHSLKIGEFVMHASGFYTFCAYRYAQNLKYLRYIINESVYTTIWIHPNTIIYYIVFDIPYFPSRRKKVMKTTRIYFTASNRAYFPIDVNDETKEQRKTIVHTFQLIMRL